MHSFIPLIVGFVIVALLLISYKLVIRLAGVVIIPQNGVGIVTKKWGFGTSGTLPDGCIIALKGEAGVQADTLAPGLHWGLYPWQFSISIVPFTTIKQGNIGVVQARDGSALSQGRVLGKRVDCDSFQNARAFLTGGGQRGAQITIVAPGTYRINTALFTVTEAPITEIDDNQVGLITAMDGQSLPSGEIAGPAIDGHNSFQDGDTFITNGGCKGLQEQVLMAGRYFLNPQFVSVECVPMVEVPIAHAGVVISYVGKTGVDVTGDSFKHGNLVEKGCKGVWVEPLDPGRYALNTRCYKVENVPTANVVLNWATGKTEAHKLDERLSTITVRSKDGFAFNLDVSQIVHVARNDAPRVIARFGSMLNLVTQVLEPTIGNYFRNAAQSNDVIDFLSNRSVRQADARAQITAALNGYNIGAVDTLIGDIAAPAELMKPLTDRKVAEQQKVTYQTQQAAEDVRKELEQSRAVANTQAKVVDSERSVAIARFAAQAAVEQANGIADAKTRMAAADAAVTKLTGEADAGKVLAIGTAEATVVKLKGDAITSDSYAAIEISKALAGSGQRLVPEIVAGGTSGGGSSLVEMLMLRMLKGNPGRDPIVNVTATAPAKTA